MGTDDGTGVRGRGQAGMTILELLIAMVVFGIVATAALNFFRTESRSFRRGTERMDVLQNLRFTVNSLEKDLRTTGANAPHHQPFLVYAGGDAVAFNADYATNSPADVFAVYYDPDLQTGEVTALMESEKITLPGTSFAYPDTTYRMAGTNSPAETLVYFFVADSSTQRGDDFALFRQINTREPELVSRNLLRTDGEPFFQYHRIREQASGGVILDSVPEAALPLAHSARIHGSAADVGAAAVIDSVRAVRVRFRATNGQSGQDEHVRSISRLIRVPNAGVAHRKTCGDEPLLGGSLTLTPAELPSGDSAVRLDWDEAVDEAAGEKDVVRYVIWRRPSSQAEWKEAALHVPSGNAPYVYDDTEALYGVDYHYAVAAQDCTPSLSDPVTAGPIQIPGGGSVSGGTSGGDDDDDDGSGGSGGDGGSLGDDPTCPFGGILGCGGLLDFDDDDDDDGGDDDDDDDD